jgi:hypothetical protein
MRHSYTFGKWTLAFLVCAILLAGPAFGDEASVSHELDIHLHPEQRLLEGVDTITISGGEGERLRIRLAQEADIREVAVNDRPAEYRFEGGKLTVFLDGKEAGAGGDSVNRITVAYSAVFDDPYPENPVNTDNPGYGVTGIISGKGVFLLAGSGWYPAVDGVKARFSIRVTAPQGMVAVTAGRSMGRRAGNGRTISLWQIDRAAEAISLSAGPYRVSERRMGEITLATYFFEKTQKLSRSYLDASERYIRLYTELFGPYPFEKFAVVENFFPTGYGFASYTLIGGRVLRLPFIIHTSLGHEIAHCWWGNGVHVEMSRGNWSEGLTSYVAEHLYKERESGDAARGLRRKWLKNYASLVDEESDFPLAEFTRRHDRVSQVIGYNKGAMVFHMVRKRIGDEAFWGALQEVYREKLFEEAAWGDFREAFERRGCGDDKDCLKSFFDQWLYRTGAPLLSLSRGNRRQADGGTWKVSGNVRQKEPVYHLRLPISVRLPRGRLLERIGFYDENADFHFSVEKQPIALELDPDVDIFRRLYPEEIPFSVNMLKGADSVLAVVSDAYGKQGMRLADLMARSLALNRPEFVSASRISRERMKGRALLFIGYPEDRDLLSRMPPAVKTAPGHFSIGAEHYDSPGSALFAVFAHPLDRTESRDRHRIRKDGLQAGGKPLPAALFYAPDGLPGPRTGAKITHYGGYSYLAFRNGENTAKGVWPVAASPLIVRWEEPEKEK